MVPRRLPCRERFRFALRFPWKIERVMAAENQKLVIVESPTKAKTIGKYLGNDYQVRASMGHVRDLPKSTKTGLGVEVNGGVKLTYAVITKAKKFLTELKRDAKDAPLVFLATDPDLEGEAIAWP